MLPALLSDSYKQFHKQMYPENLTLLYSNMTPRKSRMQTDKAVFFGLQYYLKEYLINQWDSEFFMKPWEEIEAELKRFHKSFSMVDFDCSHWEQLHKVGHLPIEIKALPEGTLVPMRVPFFTIKNTDENFAWLVNFLETQISTVIWDLTTVATISHEYRKLLNKYAMETAGNTEFVQWQGHDFSMRGRSSIESSLNQAGHLLSFTGTDTIPAVYFLEKYYGANLEKELIAGSVPATEHSVMMAGGKGDEVETFSRLLDLFPVGIVSVVSDTWDLWKVCTEYLPKLKDKVMARNGKLVIRPDSGDPVDIICGVNTNPEFEKLKGTISEYQAKGVIELLWDVFGGTVNEKGYKVLDPHIGAIYGDSITLERAEEICERLKLKGFASTNIVLGIGSYTFNYNTRDTLGMAIKATYCERDGEGFEIFKDPVTDDGTKKSAKGLMCVLPSSLNPGEIYLKDQCTWEEEKGGLLETVFYNSHMVKEHTLAEIRERLANQ